MKYVLIVIFAFLALIMLIMLMSIDVSAEYYENRFLIYCRVGIFKIRLYPPKYKKDGVKRKEIKNGKLNIEKINKYIELVKYLLEIIPNTVIIDDISAHIIIGDSNPAKAGMLYGLCAAAVSETAPLINDVFKVKHKDIEINIDFDKKEIYADFYINIYGRVYRLLSSTFKISKKYKVLFVSDEVKK